MKIHLSVLLLMLSCYLLLGLGGYGLLDNNEGLYAEIAREMAESRSFVIPLLNGVPYLEKPPMLYWLVASAYGVFGQSEFAARLVPAAAAVSTVFALIWLGRRARRIQAGKLAALILGSSACFVMLSRTLIADMVLTAFFSLALIFLYWYFRDDVRRDLRWSYVFLALAALTKGLVALVLFVAIAGLFLLIARRSGRKGSLRAFFDPLALGLFLAIALPWHVLASVQNRDFAWFYFINEHVFRFLGLRMPKDYRTGPWYYYLPRILAGMFPWSLFLPVLFKRERKRPPNSDLLPTFLWLWFLVPLAFFSLSGAKANYYMIVGMPPLAFLLAEKIRLLFSRESSRELAALTGLIPLFGLIAVTVIVQVGNENDPRLALFTDGAFLPLFGLFLALSIAAIMLLIVKRRSPALYAIALSCAPLLILLLMAMDRAEPSISSKPLARYLNSSAEKKQVFLYKDFEELSALPFYLKRPLPVIESASNDLRFGITYSHDPERFMSAKRFVSLSRDATVFVVVMEKRLKEFSSVAAAAGLPEVRRTGKAVLFTNEIPFYAGKAILAMSDKI